MKKINLLLSILLFLGFTNLKAQNAQKEPKPGKYAVVIMFNSIGSGIDAESFDKINAYITNHPKKPAVQVIQKGREGEQTMYLKLNELSKKEKNEFIEEVEKLIVHKNLVMVEKDFEVKAKLKPVSNSK